MLWRLDTIPVGICDVGSHLINTSYKLLHIFKVSNMFSEFAIQSRTRCTVPSKILGSRVARNSSSLKSEAQYTR